jgi:hypothetical protein
VRSSYAHKGAKPELFLQTRHVCDHIHDLNCYLTSLRLFAEKNALVGKRLAAPDIEQPYLQKGGRRPESQRHISFYCRGWCGGYLLLELGYW